MVVIPAARPAQADSIVVNSLSDLSDWAPLDGVCETAMGTGICTLRAAIQTAYQYDTIDFADSLNGYTIYLNHSGPPLESLVMTMDHVTIDGSGHNITISGQYMSHAPGTDGECLRMAGNNDTVQYLTIRDCPTWGVMIGEYENNNYGDSNTLMYMNILGNASGGVSMEDTDGDGYGGNDNTILYSNIGSATPNPSSCIPTDSNYDGVALYNHAHSNHIYANQIVCNNGTGVYSYHTESNHIESNTIAANLGSGIRLTDSEYTTIDVNVIGNFYGSDYAGNGLDGITIEDGSHNITIGGASPGNANTIGGNIYSGIYIMGNSHTITINSNTIGIDYTATSRLSNGSSGIAIEGNTIDSSLANAIVIGDDNFTTSHQYISGNGNDGVYISNSNNVRIKDSNLIGRGYFPANPDVAMGNGWDGVYISNSHHITVGGYAIAYNGWQGVGMLGDLSLNNQVKPLRVYANGGLGIDLNEDGFTPNDLNDSDAGPNTLLNYPVVTGISGGYLSGTVCADCRVYFFLAKGDPSKAGGGYVENNLGYVTADGSGFWSVPYPLGTGVTVNKLAMLSLHVASGTTSEVSPRPQFFIPLVKKQ